MSHEPDDMALTAYARFDETGEIIEAGTLQWVILKGMLNGGAKDITLGYASLGANYVEDGEIKYKTPPTVKYSGGKLRDLRAGDKIYIGGELKATLTGKQTTFTLPKGTYSVEVKSVRHYTSIFTLTV